MKKDIDKIRGALYGVAVGDALGAPLEFMTAEDIRLKHGYVREMLGGGWLNVEPGEVTDDTQMTIAVAMGIVENPDDPVPAVGENFIRWYDGSPKDIGGTCRAAIALAKERHASTREDWLNVGKTVAERNGDRSGGNGALMRTVYTGLYYNEPIEQTKDIAMMTHWDSGSNACCIHYALMIRDAVRGQDIYEDIAAWIRNTDSQEDPTGWSKDSMSCALRCIMATDSFEESVCRAVNLGGDADTIGAITGGLAGAIYGFKEIPQKWRVILDSRLPAIIEPLALTAREVGA